MTFIPRPAHVFITAALLALTACSSTPKPTMVKTSVEAQQKINPSIHGVSSPVVVRIYALKSLAAFNGADFFSLADKDKEILGAELLDREELQLKPGEKRELQKQYPPETRYVGVTAAFRDLERSQWRASTAVPPQKKSNVKIQLEGNTVSVVADK